MESKTESLSKIINLNGYLKLYEIFGLQFFSLKVAVEKNYTHQFSIYRTAYFLVLLALASNLGYNLLIHTFQSEVTSKNILTMMYSQWLNYFIFMTHFANFVQSFKSTGNILEFLKNSEKIADLCHEKFKLKMNFTNVRKAAWRQFFVVMAFFFLILGASIYLKSDNAFVFVAEFILYGILLGLPMLTTTKFIFYVCFVNYQLRFLQKVLLLSVEGNNMKPKSALHNMNNFERSNEIIEKLLVACKIYRKIKRNSMIINSCTGLIISSCT